MINYGGLAALGPFYSNVFVLISIVLGTALIGLAGGSIAYSKVNPFTSSVVAAVGLVFVVFGVIQSNLLTAHEGRLSVVCYAVLAAVVGGAIVLGLVLFLSNASQSQKLAAKLIAMCSTLILTAGAVANQRILGTYITSEIETQMFGFVDKCEVSDELKALLKVPQKLSLPKSSGQVVWTELDRMGNIDAVDEQYFPRVVWLAKRLARCQSPEDHLNQLLKSGLIKTDVFEDPRVLASFEFGWLRSRQAWHMTKGDKRLSREASSDKAQEELRALIKALNL
jgi:hypothetical protein